jgi:hypothetical protein
MVGENDARHLIPVPSGVAWSSTLARWSRTGRPDSDA